MSEAPIQDLVNKAKKGWLLYDARCGFCSYFVPRCRGIINKAGYLITPIQSHWIAEFLNTPTEELIKEIRIAYPNKKLISGADVYIHILSSVWWTKLLGIFLNLPGMYYLTTKVYRLINNNRYLISKTCRLRPEIE